MKRVGCIVGTFALVAACVGDDPSSSNAPPGPDGGATETGPGQGGCGLNEKPCDGKCVALTDPTYGCDPGTCAAPCQAAAAPNSTASCDGTKCSTACSAGYADCDGNPTNGCEVRTADDALNCGACNSVCGTANATSRACVNGKCEFNCQAGFGHCLADDSKGCETQVNATDAKHCGRCARDCIGGTCTAGECSVVVVKNQINKPVAVALDATYAYFASDGTSQIFRVQKDGNCNPATPCPVDLLPSGGVSMPQSLATDGTNLFWANYGNAATKVRRSSAIGASPADVGDTWGSFAGFLAIGGGKVFWSNRYTVGARVYKADLAGTNVAAVATGGSEGGGLAADATHVYWAEVGASGKIYKAAVGAAPCVIGTDCASLVDANVPYAVAVGNLDVYYSEFGTDTIKRVPKAGGQVATIATAQPDAPRIATDGVHVYWISAGAVRRVKADVAMPCDGSSCEKIGDAFIPTDVAVDGAAVYWVDHSDAPYGGVYKRAK